MDKQTLDFIRKHKLNELDFFDAKGRTAADCRIEMKNKNKPFHAVVGVFLHQPHTLYDSYYIYSKFASKQLLVKIQTPTMA